MKTPKFVESIKGTACRAAFKVKKNSPEILFVVGIGGVIFAAVKACRATTKLNDTITAHKEELDTIHTAAEEGVISTLDENDVAVDEVYTDKMVKRDTTKVYAKIGLDVVKLYAPSVIIGGLSIAALTTSHLTLKSRNLGLAAAYTGLEKSFKDYRQRVSDRFGPEIEREIRYNIKTEAVERTETDEKGKERKVVEAVKSFGGLSKGDNTYIFDETNPNWQKDAIFNREWLELKQNQMNNVLQAKGHLFKNEVLDELGYGLEKSGQVDGWVYDKHNPDKQDYVDFGLYQPDMAHQRFIEGAERSVLLDFNSHLIINDVDLSD